MIKGLNVQVPLKEMETNDLELVLVDWRASADEIRSVRSAVFTKEQGISSAIDLDGQDEDAVHVLALARGVPVGTGGMLSDGHIGRVAVLKDYRNRGIGRSLIEALIDFATEHSYAKVYLGSQESAIAFYLSLCFEPVGERFIEADIPHQTMKLELGCSG